MVAELATITETEIDRSSSAPGDSFVIKAKGLGGGMLKLNLYQQPGLVSRPPKGTRAIAIPVGEGRREMYSIATKNYEINFTISEGATTIYSTSADGKTLKARIELDNTGKIKIANETKNLKTILDGLIDHLAALTTIPAVVGTPLTLNPTVIANLNADKAALALLLKE
jgi:phage gp45-like